MLTLLKIKNIALIESLEVEFGQGLNLLTGETGSGKSIIVDSLGALTGDRVSGDLIKEGEQSATIEGLFSVANPTLAAIFDEAGIELAEDDELIIRRELSLTGKNRVFINNQVVTQSLLKRIGPLLVDIHGQGEQASLFDASTHLEMLDAFAGVDSELRATTEAYKTWSTTRRELEDLRKDESDKLQLLDILRFQVDEINRAGLKPGEDSELEEEKRRLNNVEKLSGLSSESFTLLYDQDESTIATLDKAAKKIHELAEFDSRFAGYREPLETARAVIEDAAATARDFRDHLEFSPTRLEEIEDRLAEISRLTRKYGGTINAVLDHLAEASKRLENIETAELREQELEKRLGVERKVYIDAATLLHDRRAAAASKFAKEVETNLKTVALEKARFEVRVEAADSKEASDASFTARGFDRVEFFFSANPGESPKPLVKVASGGEASRLMLILKTTAKEDEGGKSAVFDEVDAGVGGRVAEAVGLKLKDLGRRQQVLCVTHQPQVAALADQHFVVEKSMGRSKTSIGVRQLDDEARINEIARMLAGEKITDSARTHSREMIEFAKQDKVRNAKR
jgi:DNA repair protein RecN (Recombination protein N)